jgi:DNA-directed RNA polymerase subunit beta'
MTCVSARTGILDQMVRDEWAAPLFNDLVAVLDETVIRVRDCESKRGVLLRALDSPYASISLAARAEGRIAAADILSTDGATLARAGDLLTRQIVEHMAAAGVSSVLVRDPFTCDAPDGVCALCFGLDPDDATWPCADDRVGARAAVEIARAARLFHERPFTIC